MLYDPPHREQVTTAIAEWLLNTGRGYWDLLDWRGKTEHDTELELLSHQLERAGANVYRIPLENLGALSYAQLGKNLLRPDYLAVVVRKSNI